MEGSIIIIFKCFILPSIRFYSNWDVSSQGFKLFYESIPSPCGAKNNFVARSGHLSSLRYRFNYIGNPDCIYRISSKNGTSLKISIKDIQLNNSHEGQCSDSFLEVRDGKFHTSPLMNKLQGVQKLHGIVMWYFSQPNVVRP